ncbi:MAG: ATP-binding protein [Synergistaceae bacterium]|nr:ATP-binding protein [Synergistaceae bacterium]
MTYTEFIEEIKKRAQEELSYPYDSMTFYPEGFTSEDPEILEFIMNSNAVYCPGEPSPWLKTDLLVLMDARDGGEMKSFQRIATKNLYEKLNDKNFDELFAPIKKDHEISIKNASTIHDRADYNKVQLILRPLNYQHHEQELYDAVYKRFDDVALVLYQLIEAKVSERTAIASKTDFVSSRIHKLELKAWNVTEEQAWDDAMKNTCRLFPPHVFHFKKGHEVDFLKEPLKISDIMFTGLGIRGILLTTSVTTNGAVALFYPGVVEKMMRILGGAFVAVFMNVNDVMIFEKDSPFAESSARSTLEEPIKQAGFLSQGVYICDKNGIRLKKNDFEVKSPYKFYDFEEIFMFRRKIYDKLLEWKREAEGRTALLIEGAQRIGKSTIVEEFAKKEYESYIIIDFAVASKSVRELFEDISDLNYFFLQLQLQFHVDLVERKSLIVFDEVQLCPLARQSIKYLVKDHRYDYIETGSLISIRKNVKNILIPSEERKLNMFPMDYEEFLWAIGDNSFSLTKKFYEAEKSLGQETNRKLLRKFRLYMLVGGMPQAVNEYIATNNLRKVDLIKRDILKLYEDDFKKFDSTGRASMLFDAIPAQLNKNASRYQVSSILENMRAKDILSLIAEMIDSRTVLAAYHTNDPNVGLSANKDLTKFKLFVCDTGLFTTLMFKDRDFTENDVYEKLLSDKLPANLGYLYENAVAQILVANGYELFYHTFINEKLRHNYEIDFLIARKNKICPIEVKSSGYRTHASLDAFCKKYSSRILQKYLIYTKDYGKDADIICLPVYMTPFI